MSDSENLTPGEYIVERRTELGLSQSDLIEASGISEGTIGPLERASIMPKRAENRIKIARALRWKNEALDWLEAGQRPDPTWERQPTTDELLVEVSSRLDLVVDLLERFAERLPPGE